MLGKFPQVSPQLRAAIAIDLIETIETAMELAGLQTIEQLRALLDGMKDGARQVMEMSS